MHKDGECAIVIKGTDPLYQQKCRMEKTDFIKLLCRKENPYNPAKTNEVRRERRKKGESYLLSGSDAREKAEELRKKKVKVIKMTVDDVECLFAATASNVEIKNFPPSEAERAMMEENRKAYLQRQQDKAPIDFTEFSKPDESLEDYQERIVTVQALISAGYSRQQIRGLKMLIMDDWGEDKIMRLISKQSSLDEIANFTKNFM